MMKRRNFINTLGSGMLLSLLEMHGCLSDNKTLPKGVASPLIKELTLETAATLDSLLQFYHRLIGFPVVRQYDHSITFQTGQSYLTFQKTQTSKELPFYHFAFNIPENKILKARDWQSKRSSVIKSPKHMIDKALPKDIRHFRNWNAHSIFFWDSAGNLVEYIARHDLNNAQTGDFSSSDILYTSEIAFIVEDVNQAAEHFKSNLKLKQYRQGSEQFRAMGDEMGLLLLMKKGRVWENQTNRPKLPDVFPTNVRLADAKVKMAFEQYPYRINKN